MEEIKFHKDKITINSYDENNEYVKDIEISSLYNSFSTYMNYNVVICPDVTLGDFLTLLFPYADILDTLLISYTKGYSIYPHFELLNKDPDEPSKLNHIEIYWYGEVFDNEYNEYCSFHGISDTNESYSLSLSTLENIKHIPLKLNNEFKLYDLEKHKYLFSGVKRDLTLFDILKCIFTELTYFGSPEDKNESRNRIIGIADEYDEDSENFCKNQLNIELEEAIQDEDYEKAQEIRDEISKMINNS